MESNQRHSPFQVIEHLEEILGMPVKDFVSPETRGALINVNPCCRIAATAS